MQISAPKCVQTAETHEVTEVRPDIRQTFHKIMHRCVENRVPVVATLGNFLAAGTTPRFRRTRYLMRPLTLIAAAIFALTCLFVETQPLQAQDNLDSVKADPAPPQGRIRE
jgi:hypothetical protein